MHRFAGLLATAFVLAHIVLVVAVNPANLGLLDIAHAPNRARAATGALGVVIALTVLRRRRRHRYEVWRWVLGCASCGSDPCELVAPLSLTRLHWLAGQLSASPAG